MPAESTICARCGDDWTEEEDASFGGECGECHDRLCDVCFYKHECED